MHNLANFKEKFIGDKAFYKRVLFIALPMIGQNAITSLVSFLDNIMVGMIGTEQMSGVAIVNQLIFVFNLAIFGGLSGPGIYGAQYFGQGNKEGFQYVFRLKYWIGIIAAIAGIPCNDSVVLNKNLKNIERSKRKQRKPKKCDKIELFT